MATTEGQGKCLCGAVSITVAEMSTEVHACHCSMCRQWAGGPWLVVDCGTNVTFDGNEQIATYSSSDWAERGFCKTCGTNLFYRLQGSGQHFMPSALFGENDAFKMTEQIFVDEQPKYYCFANETAKLTGAEVFAKFAPPE